MKTIKMCSDKHSRAMSLAKEIIAIYPENNSWFSDSVYYSLAENIAKMIEPYMKSEGKGQVTEDKKLEDVV